MDLNETVIFARVVQAGSFTSAARLLDMPKSSVSRKIAELEDHLGARLLQRTTRKLSLTDAGRIYYEHSARIVAELEAADQAMASMQAAPRGLLRVTAPLNFVMLGPLAVEFLRRHPDVKLDLVCTDRRVDLVEEGFDVAIRAGALDDSSLIARNLGTIERVLVAAPGYCKAHGTPKVPADLEKHACIAFAVGPTPTTWTLHAGDRTVDVRVAPRLASNDFDVIGAAVRAGVGIAWMPAFASAEDRRAGRLRQVLPDWSSAATPVNALYPSARHLSPKVGAFIDLARERFSLPT